MSRALKQNLFGCLLAALLGMGLAFCRAPSRRTGSSAGETPPSAAEQGRAPEPSLVEAVRHESGVKRWLRILAASEEATAAEIPRLMLLARDDSQAVELLARRWARLDPHHMFQLLYAESLLPPETPGLLPERRGLPYLLFAEWVKTDGPAAAAALSNVPDFPERGNLRNAVVSKLLDREDQGSLVLALTKFAEWNPDLSTANFIGFRHWIMDDPRAAAEAVMRIGYDKWGNDFLSMIGGAWGESDPRAATVFARTLPGRAREVLAGPAVKEWAKSDLPGALEFLRSETDPAFRKLLGAEMLSQWAKADPVAAMAWNQENFHGESRLAKLREIMAAAGDRHSAQGAEIIASLDEAPDRELAASALFQSWAARKSESAAALAWVASLPEASLRRKALDPGLEKVLRDAPAELMQVFDGPLAAEVPRAAVQTAAAQQLTAQGIAAAVQWSESLTPEQGETARRTIYGEWLPKNPDAAQTFARDLPEGPARQELIAALAQTLAYGEAPKAVAWMQTLPAAEQQTAWAIFEKTNARTPAKMDEARKLR